MTRARQIPPKIGPTNPRVIYKRRAREICAVIREVYPRPKKCCIFSEKKDQLLREVTQAIEDNDEDMKRFEESLSLSNLKYMDAIPIENRALPQEGLVYLEDT